MFRDIDSMPPDALYAASAACAADPRPNKIDLTVGVYRDREGRSPIMAAVKAAETRLVREQMSKAYRPLLGDPDFLQGMTALVFGDNHPLLAQERVVAIQSTGGTGALRLAAALAKSASAGARLHLGTPSWPSHAGVFAAEGIEVLDHRYWMPGAIGPSSVEIHAAAAASRSNDLFLLHGPCHNPTGIDLTSAQRHSIALELSRTGAIPVLDVAYYGLGDGLDRDLDVVRQAIAPNDRAMIALSCSKAFGLYRDRTGVLFVKCVDAEEARRVATQLGMLSRHLVSSAPAHGAEVVARILSDLESATAWRAELETMRQRIVGLRRQLASSSQTLGSLAQQKGIFAMLPITSAQVAKLAEEDAIYLPHSGRANLVGLGDADVARFAEALDRILTARHNG